MRADFAGSPSDDDLDAISIVETEIDADFLDHCDADTDIEVVAPQQTMSPLSSGLAQLRAGGGGGTVCQH